MSTKIYQAYRMSLKVFENEFLPSFRKFTFDHAVERVKRLIGMIADDQVEEYNKNLSKNHLELVSTVGGAAYLLKSDHAKVAVSLLVEISKSPVRQPLLDIDTSFNAWIYRGKVYVIPYGEFVQEFEPPEAVENYEYWNNSDPPEGISNRAWQVRKKTWEAVCLADWNARRLTQLVVEVNYPYPKG